jgi:hypothetical protein
MSHRIQRVRDLYDNMDSRIVPGIIGGALIIGVLFFALRGTGDTDATTVQITIDAAATMTNAQFPVLAANLSQTPADSALTGVAPTLMVSGRDAVDQYAASATATSERGSVDYSAVQAVGQPDTLTCGDARTAWSPAQPNTVDSITLYFPELVKPTGLIVYQNNSPGFITRITITDTFGEVHTVYEAIAQLNGACPWELTVSIPDGIYPANIVTIYIDQSFNTSGTTEIDSVRLFGIRY